MYFFCLFFFFKQKTAYEMRISDWSSDVCSSDLDAVADQLVHALHAVDRDTDLGGLAALAQQRDLVDGERIRLVPGGGIDAHAQRVEGHLLGAGQTLGQAVRLVLVHHEADGAAVHAVDRHAEVDEEVEARKKGGEGK